MPDKYGINSFVGLQSYEVIRWKRYHKRRLELWLELRGKKYRCGKCRKVFTPYHDRTWVCLRDLSIAQHQVYLWVYRYRVKCPQCGPQQAELTLARIYARCTRRFERWLFRLTKGMTVKEVSELVQVDWRLVKEVEIRYIVGLLRRRDLDGITELGIDEVSEKKGHRYLTLVTDLQSKRVIWVGRGRDRAV